MPRILVYGPWKRERKLYFECYKRPPMTRNRCWFQVITDEERIGWIKVVYEACDVMPSAFMDAKKGEFSILKTSVNYDGYLSEIRKLLQSRENLQDAADALIMLSEKAVIHEPPV